MKRAGYLVKWSLFTFGLRYLSIIIYTLLVVKIFHINIPNDNLTPNFMYMVIFAPILEESIFRGPIYLAVKFDKDKEMKLLTFFLIFILGIFFGLAHITNLELHTSGAIWYGIERIPGGIIYGLVVYRTRSLIPTIITHSLVNYMAYIAVVY